MPEGDTIHRIARRLAPLTGKLLERVTTQGLVRDLAGRTVASIAPHGKHLTITLDNGTELRMHLGMNGRFRHYDRATGDAMLAKISPGRASLALVVADAIYLWIGARTVEISDRRAAMRGMAVASLGPDVLADDFDPAGAAATAADHGTRMISEVLLDQRIAAGIGNIYKCESLFVTGIDPRTRTSALSLPQLESLYRTARELMRQNLGPAPRATRDTLRPSEPIPGLRYHVYSRTGQACSRCGTPIACYRLGDPPRWTWSCERCQRLG
jgi:endonuclease VIII